MSKRIVHWLIPMLGLFLSIASQAQETNPDALVKNVTEEVLLILQQDRDQQAGKRERASALIEEKVAPHFDFQRMTSLAVGPGWRSADTKQRNELVEEFRTLLVRTYANALAAYKNQTVTFKPSREPATGAGEVTVRSQINQAGGPPISLDYTLARAGNAWKVFDVTIDNVSLVTNYRSNFGAEVNKGGIDGLIKSLQNKNQRLTRSAAG